MVPWQTKANRVRIADGKDDEDVEGGSGADGPICVSDDITAHNQDETEVTDPFKQAHTDFGFPSFACLAHLGRIQSLAQDSVFCLLCTQQQQQQHSGLNDTEFIVSCGDTNSNQ